MDNGHRIFVGLVQNGGIRTEVFQVSAEIYLVRTTQTGRKGGMDQSIDKGGGQRQVPQSPHLAEAQWPGMIVPI